MVSSTNWRIVDAAATFVAASCEDSDSYEAATEKNIEDEAQESEEGDATEEAGKDDGEGSVDDSCSGHALNRLLPCWNVTMVVC